MQDKKPEEKKRIYSSMFVKMFIAFILIGLIPLLLTGQILYMRLSSSVEEVMISNASQMAVNMGKNVSDLIGKYDDITQSLYDYTSDDYLYFYELLDDTELEEEERERQITNILYNIMNMDRSIQNVRFIYDKIYNVSRDSTKNMDIRKVLDAQWKPREEDLNSLYIMPTHSESNYYYNSEEKVFTMARNYMDVSTMRTAGSRRMGTLYVDFDPSELEILEEGMDMGEDSEVVVADAKDGTVNIQQGFGEGDTEKPEHQRHSGSLGRRERGISDRRQHLCILQCRKYRLESTGKYQQAKYRRNVYGQRQVCSRDAGSRCADSCGVLRIFPLYQPSGQDVERRDGKDAKRRTGYPGRHPQP